VESITARISKVQKMCFILQPMAVPKVVISVMITPVFLLLSGMVLNITVWATNRSQGMSMIYNSTDGGDMDGNRKIRWNSLRSCLP
jgi:hypothetical protein